MLYILELDFIAFATLVLVVMEFIYKAIGLLIQLAYPLVEFGELVSHCWDTSEDLAGFIFDLTIIYLIIWLGQDPRLSIIVWILVAVYEIICSSACSRVTLHYWSLYFRISIEIGGVSASIISYANTRVTNRYIVV